MPLNVVAACSASKAALPLKAMRFATVPPVVPIAALLAVSLLCACDEGSGTDPFVQTGPDNDVSDVTDADAVGDDADVPAPDGDIWEELEYPAQGVEARFDLAASLDDDFFAFPFPSDARLNELGGPELSSFPTNFGVGLLGEAARVAEETVRGFSVVGTVYFMFDSELDPATLPVDAAAATRRDATAFIIDIDPESPWYGQRHPLTAEYRLEGGLYWQPSTVALSPLLGLPLRTATTYAAIVTTSVTAPDGTPAVGGAAFREVVLGQSDDSELTALYAPLIDALPDLRIHPNSIAAATVYTTGDPAQELMALRSWLLSNVVEPVIEGVFQLSNGHVYDLYEGTFPMEEFFDGEAPYRDFGEGTLTIAADGRPATRTPIDVRFALAIPSGEPPETGWPVVLYSHGTGGSYLSINAGPAGELARRGIATFCFDQPLHGARNPTLEDELDLILSLTISNIIVGRDMLRQHVADLYQATRLLRSGIEVPAEVSESGRAISIDPDRIAFMGHSQGAQVGALFIPLEPDMPTGVLSEGGGGAVISLLEREENDLDIAEIVSAALGLAGNDEVLAEGHPAIGAIIQPLLEPADPLAYARLTFLEPPHGVAHNFLMTEGLQDAATPPRTIESLASATGLPIAEPIAADIEGLIIQGIPSVRLPTRANLPGTDGVRPTGALLQFIGRNHYLTSRDYGARYQVYEFLRTALEGQPTIFPGEDR